MTGFPDKDGGAFASSRKPWLKRIGWLALIWAASVLALGILSYGLRLVMAAVGLHT